MPRPNRNRPGARIGGGGGGIDLGAILQSVFGGVEANPAYDPANADITEFTGIAKPQADDFYKPKWVFDKARAREANAAFKADQFTTAQDQANTIEQARQTNNMGILGQHNILSMPGNAEQFQSTTFPNALSGANQGILARAAAAREAEAQANLVADTTAATRDSVINNARSKAAIDASRSKNLLDKGLEDLQEGDLYHAWRDPIQAGYKADSDFEKVIPGVGVWSSRLKKFTTPPYATDYEKTMTGIERWNAAKARGIGVNSVLSNQPPSGQPQTQSTPVQQGPQNLTKVMYNGKEHLYFNGKLLEILP